MHTFRGCDRSQPIGQGGGGERSLAGLLCRLQQTSQDLNMQVTQRCCSQSDSEEKCNVLGWRAGLQGR